MSSRAALSGPVEYYPLTTAQRRHLSSLSTPRDSGTASYTHYFSWRISGELDVPRFIGAVRKTVDAYDALRIGLSPSDPGRQWVRAVPDGRSLITCERVNCASEAIFDGYVKRILAREISTAWALDARYPFTFHLLQYSPRLHAFVAAFSHLSLDYRGRELVKADIWRRFVCPPDSDAADHSQSLGGLRFVDAAERSGENTSARHRADAYWAAKKKALPAKEGARNTDEKPGRLDDTACWLRVTGAALDALRTRARQRRATEFHLLMAAVGAAIFDFVPQDSIVVAVPVDTRALAETEVPGMYAVVLPVLLRRSDPDSLLAQARDELLGLVKHRNLSAEALTDLHDGSVDTGGGIAFTYVVEPDGEPIAAGAAGVVADESYYSPQVARVSSGIGLIAISRNDILELQVVLNPDLFSESDARTFMHTLERRLGSNG
ncbi:condensation domain-containing protein (plasmid) [Streptomyces viridifaciens]|nr:condensation domain-containing protein [Streptomyces viridifaciens]